MKISTILSITTLAIASTVIAGTVYKCVDTAGNVSYSPNKCPEKSSSKEIESLEPHKSSSITSHQKAARVWKDIEDLRIKQQNLTGTSQRKIDRKRCNLYRKELRRAKARGEEGSEISYLQLIENNCEQHLTDTFQKKIDRKRCNLYRKELRRAKARGDESSEIHYLQSIEDYCK